MTEHKPDPHIQLATLPAVCYPATLDLADAVLSHEGTVYFYRDAAYSQRMQTTMVAQPGTETYYILVDNEGCILKTSMQATINEIDIELSGDLHLCAEEDYAVSMRMVGPQASQYSYQWTSSLGAVQDKLVFPQSTITDVASENITYSLHVANGACQVDETVLVEVNPLPVYTVDTSDKDSVFVQLQSSGYEPYEFNFEPTGSQAWGSFVRPEPGNYLVSVIDNYGCKTEQYVDIERILVPLVIPPFFTPNGDGVNDIWHIENIEYYPEAVIRIYDRFSKLVAEYNGTVPGWDGTYRGHPMVSTDYWYYIKIEVLGKPISGHVTLFRGKGAD